MVSILDRIIAVSVTVLLVTQVGIVTLLDIQKIYASDAQTVIQVTHVTTRQGNDESASQLSPPDKVAVVSCPAQVVLTAQHNNLTEFIDAVFEGLNAVANGQRPINYIATQFDTFNPPANGHWTEFGVFKGGTLSSAHWALKRSKVFNGTIAGFDSFLGLPSEWRSGYQEGRFMANYNEVRSTLPDEIKLYKGWFQDTIDGFLREHPGPMALIHHDGDLFVSTAITFQLLSHRIVPGTILCFDELVGYPGYEKHEILSFFLWMHQYNAKVCPIAFLEPFTDEMRLGKTEVSNAFSQSACFQVVELHAKTLAD